MACCLVFYGSEHVLDISHKHLNRVQNIHYGVNNYDWLTFILLVYDSEFPFSRCLFVP